MVLLLGGGHNSVGNSPDSGLEAIETQVQTEGVPDAPTDLTLSKETAGEVVISWTAPADGPDPEEYRVYRSNLIGSNLRQIATVPAESTTYTDDTVREERWYAYRVRAANSQAEGPESIQTRVQTPGVPNQPTETTASEDTAGEVVITWTAPTDGPDPTGYKVYRERITAGGERGKTQVGTTGTETSFTDETVAPEVMYIYTVRAKNDAGHGSESNMAFITTGVQNDGAPPAPEDTSADQ